MKQLCCLIILCWSSWFKY